MPPMIPLPKDNTFRDNSFKPIQVEAFSFLPLNNPGAIIKFSNW